MENNANQKIGFLQENPIFNEISIKRYLDLLLDSKNHHYGNRGKEEPEKNSIELILKKLNKISSLLGSRNISTDKENYYNPQNKSIYIPTEINERERVGDMLHQLAHHIRKDNILNVSSLEDVYKEDLIAELVSTQIANRYSISKRVDRDIASRLDYYRSKVENDSYLQDVLKETKKTSYTLEKYLALSVEEELQEDEDKLDLQTTTPGNVDSDDDGIIDSQENFVADRKQGDREKNAKVKHDGFHR